MTVFYILAPMVIIIAIGYLTVLKGFFSTSFVSDAGKFVLFFSLPAVIFNGVVKLDIQNALNMHYMIIYALSALSSMLLAIVVSHQFLKLNWKECFINGLGSGVANSAFIGLPIVMFTFDGRLTEAFIMCVLIENTVLIPVSLILLELSSGRGVGLREQIKQISRRLLKNPIIIAILGALFFNLISIELPQVAEDTLGIISKTSVALALFVIGGMLAQSFIISNVSRTLLVAGIKLIISPCLVLLFVLIWPISHDLKYALIIFCATPMLSIYPILGSLYGQQLFCASTLVVTTVLSGVTLSVIIYLMTYN
jgi:malonate transporter